MNIHMYIYTSDYKQDIYYSSGIKHCNENSESINIGTKL